MRERQRKNAPNRSTEALHKWSFALMDRWHSEDMEEAVKQILEALRARGLKVPEWIVTKCRERVIEIRRTRVLGETQAGS